MQQIAWDGQLCIMQRMLDMWMQLATSSLQVCVCVFGMHLTVPGAGCPVSKYDSNGLTPGHLAAYKGYVAVLEKLLHAGFYHDMQGGLSVLHNNSGSTALHMAATKGHGLVIKQLLAEGASVQKEDFRGLNPLQCAAEGGHLEAFNHLLEVDIFMN